MNLEDVDKVLSQIRDDSGLDEFVIVGSLAALGVGGAHRPARMTMSMEVDAYPAKDPGRAPEFSKKFGEDSAFHRENGFYFDAISPALPTLPEGWKSRTIHQVLPSGVKVQFLDPNDCAISKLARSEPKDREWVSAGLRGGILSLPTIEYRMRETQFLDAEEQRKAYQSLKEDRAWLEAQPSTGNTKP
ncbi:DUF6036 family nucleotidyltransferase [Rhodoferax saidenbachensis]|uniref:DUF6036 domain-containing protein n=1 Tax=Rhodoferax saidenbachensis TaxID=1484693 RepID=A0ABU1ZPY5_9BURK|nr:DUF6036 family nucleotidyltransferase [Rhodoferax saidenbachensis]MDR7307443.1 hypothetical protein [Rhodoferax saidenbachensis]